MHWTIHTQGPDELVCIIEADGTSRFIARLDEELKTRAEVMTNGFLLAAAPELLEACKIVLKRLDLEAVEREISGQDCVFPCAALRSNLRAAIAKAEGTPCDHNECVPNDEPDYAWKCAKCGYVYGKED